jgi:hypothetical protein
MMTDDRRGLRNGEQTIEMRLESAIEIQTRWLQSFSIRKNHD